MRPEIILLIVGLLLIALAWLAKRYGSGLWTTASGYQKQIRLTKRSLFTAALVVFLGISLYRGWHPSILQISKLMEIATKREGVYCFGGIEIGIGNEVEEFQDGLIPPSNCMYATIHLEYPSSEHIQVVITYMGTGRWAYYGQEGEIRTKPFPESNFGQPVEARWRWSNTADGFRERSGWLACTQMGKRFSCQGKLLTGGSAGDSVYEPVTFNEKPTRRR